MWIERKGLQHRVYWRTNLPKPSPKKTYEAFSCRPDAERFIALARMFGLPGAQRVVGSAEPQAVLAELWSASKPAGIEATCTVAPTAPEAAAGPDQPVDPRALGVTFDVLWERFLGRQRHQEEGTCELYTSYGTHHLLPFFGSTDLGLIRRTKPLRDNDAAGVLYVDDDWVPAMMAKPRLNNVGRPMAGTLLSIKFISNVLVVLGQCFDLAVQERPALLEVNPARHIRLPKQDRREMHFLPDAAAYLSLRCQMEVHFRTLLDFLVGTGARYGEAAGLLVRNLHLDAATPHVDIRLALKWRGKKWKLGRPKTQSSIRRITLPPRLVEVLRPLVAGKGEDEHVFTMVEGGPLHHGHFYNRYFKPAVKAAAGIPKGMRIHDLRHTHAAWLLSDGIAPFIVSRRLGHSSITTTTDLYGHVTPEADEGALVKVNDRLPDILARDDDGAAVVRLTTAELALPEFDIDDLDDLAA